MKSRYHIIIERRDCGDYHKIFNPFEPVTDNIAGKFDSLPQVKVQARALATRHSMKDPDGVYRAAIFTTDQITKLYSKVRRVAHIGSRPVSASQ